MAYCDRCNRYFSSQRSLEQHREDSSAHYQCDDCDKDFATWNTLVQHWVDSPRHDYCRHCDEHFDDEDELLEHYEDEHYRCSDCEEVFNSQQGLDLHLEQVHWYCADCRRIFSDENALRNHLRSTLHAGQTVPCPGKKCHKMFVSGAALVNHLESGACPSCVTREMVNRIAAKYDTKHIITNPARMIGYTESGSWGARTVATWATSLSWNGDEYECFLCHRGFAALDRLNQHLASPAHEADLYRCPKGYSGCGKEFKTLSGLCKHVESEKCGIRRFNGKMQNYLGDLTSKMKRLAL